ncbi:hypothetical protein HPB51_005034 [Rhipicephalus microplus]|uniref:Uncharacterized protein n=1 Tax=Rhipicephalus microplus TaxID=6941 RepID=A0A9J6E6E8_RHIMP|nr:hypothetical protein HPB51_005034 [Rhipicephalus microplus]
MRKSATSSRAAANGSRKLPRVLGERALRPIPAARLSSGKLESSPLDGLLRSLLRRIVLKEKLDAAGTFSKLIKIDLENPNNIIGIAAFDIGLAAKKVDVTDKMIDMVRSSNIKWKEDLERKKKERLDVLDAERKKKRTAALVKELESKKQKLMEDAQLQVSMLQQEIESLKQ